MMPEPGNVIEWASALDQTVVDGALTFATPEWFYALVLPVLAGLLFFWSWVDARRRAGMLVSDRLRVLLVREHPTWMVLLQMALLLAACTLLVTALARPQKGFIEVRRMLKAANIVFLMDTSRSMLAADETPNRLERARLAALDLLDLLPGERIAVVAVSGNAYVLAPITMDHTAVAEVLRDLDTTTVPRGGTHFARGFKECAKVLAAARGGSRAVVFFTDGEDLEEGAEAAVRELAADGVVVHALAFGTTSGTTITVRDADGREDFIRDPQGNIVLSRLNLELLRRITAAGGGLLLQPARDGGALRLLAAHSLSQLSRAALEDTVKRVPNECFHWPLGLGIICLAAGLLMSGVPRVSD